MENFSSNLKHPLVIGAICVVALALLMRSKIFVADDKETPPIEISDLSPAAKPPPLKETNVILAAGKSAPKSDDAIETSQSNSGVDYGQNERRRESIKTSSEFMKHSYLQAEMPQELSFIPLDLNDESMAIFGSNPSLGIGMAMIAHPTSASPSQAIQYFKENADAIPNASKSPITSWSQPVPLPENAGNGLRNPTLWSARRADGSDLHVVFMTRADNRGSYMMVVSGPSQYFQQNDGYFDQLYSKFKALPPK